MTEQNQGMRPRATPAPPPPCQGIGTHTGEETQADVLESIREVWQRCSREGRVQEWYASLTQQQQEFLQGLVYEQYEQYVLENEWRTRYA
jgi:hypothetical protein